MSRHAARERALQTMFQMDVNDMSTEQAVNAADTMLDESAYDTVLFQALLNGVTLHREAIDSMLKEYSQDWEIDRMPGVDRTILRMAVFELVYQAELPHAVIMDEAVELSKEFGTEHSSRFVNGVLSGILLDLDDLRAGKRSN